MDFESFTGAIASCGILAVMDDLSAGSLLMPLPCLLRGSNIKEIEALDTNDKLTAQREEKKMVRRKAEL